MSHKMINSPKRGSVCIRSRSHDLLGLIELLGTAWAMPGKGCSCTTNQRSHYDAAWPFAKTASLAMRGQPGMSHRGGATFTLGDTIGDRWARSSCRAIEVVTDLASASPMRGPTDPGADYVVGPTPPRTASRPLRAHTRSSTGEQGTDGRARFRDFRGDLRLLARSGDVYHTVIWYNYGMTKAIIYTRVSTSEQGESGLGLEAQTTLCVDYCSRNEIEVVEVTSEVQSGKSTRRRPVLGSALATLRKGDADILIASNVSRLSRSIGDLVGLISEADKRGYSVVALDTGLDTSTPAGRMVFQMLGVAAEYERAMTSDRTKKALARAKAKGTQLGRRTSLPSE
jgi:DNA invertase Pin-like site-specific DNA recombinase